MEFLSKLVDILKATGLQTAALSCAAFGYIWLSRHDYVPALEGSWSTGVHLFGFGTGALAVASILSAAFSALKAAFRPLRWWSARRRAKAKFVSNIQHLSFKERQILGFLRHYNMKVFETDFDGGNAASLIAQGYVYQFMQPGQRVNGRSVPTRVADYVWDIIQAAPEAFPHQPELEGNTEIEPWRVHWMAR